MPEQPFVMYSPGAPNLSAHVIREDKGSSAGLSDRQALSPGSSVMVLLARS